MLYTTRHVIHDSSCYKVNTIVGELNLKKWSNSSLHCKSLKFLSQADMT